eukprot:CAMPEP_0175454876 /NCGR_PEP_ID=MMETSP0095-20121207/64725_1 /TAXON_ID=311494 /ORGANISM="Alexandrium monilatum, Strain CCMP3105" /LENGTH=62 /DNA_ID=CAMNT_0016755621 /DNA_START=1 /DNA_END=190 /DNA_ORIENTATION=+
MSPMEDVLLIPQQPPRQCTAQAVSAISPLHMATNMCHDRWLAAMPNAALALYAAPRVRAAVM